MAFDAATLAAAQMTLDTNALLTSALAGVGVAGLPGLAGVPVMQVPHQTGRPSNMQHIPGVTDRRWEGVITGYKVEKGFGFIRCPELRAMYPEKDAFLHKNQLGNFNDGDAVSFAVSFNKEGKPQAMELGPSTIVPAGAGFPGGGMSGMGPGGGFGGGGGGFGMGGGNNMGGNGMHGNNLGGGHMGGMGGPSNSHSMGVPGVNPPPPAPAAVPATTGPEDWGIEEFEVPAELMSRVLDANSNYLADLRTKTGPEVLVTFQDKLEGVKSVTLRGPKVLASFARCLILQSIADLL